MKLFLLFLYFPNCTSFQKRKLQSSFYIFHVYLSAWNHIHLNVLLVIANIRKVHHLVLLLSFLFDIIHVKKQSARFTNTKLLFQHHCSVSLIAAFGNKKKTQKNCYQCHTYLENVFRSQWCERGFHRSTGLIFMFPALLCHFSSCYGGENAYDYAGNTSR